MSALALAALCAAIVSVSAAPASGETRYVNAGGDLQAALNAARPGDQILLQAGAQFTGNFQLPVKASGPPITIRSSATLPDRRITPADAPLLPTIRSGNTSPALAATGAANWTLIGLRFEANANGHSNLIALRDVLHVIIDRMLFVAPPETGQHRAILGNGQHVTLTRSHIAGVWAQTLQDSQAFLAHDGAGPYTITDNYLEAASENVMFGGADSKSADRIPADILVEGNHFTKNPAWKGQRRAVKNLFELKQAKRVVVRDNLFEGNWTDAQTGTAILFKSMNDTGGSPWAVTEDVLFERNIVRDTERGIAVNGYDPYQPSGQATRITIRHNLVISTFEGLYLANEIGELTLDHNTFVNGGWGFLKLGMGGIRPAAEGGTLRQARYAVAKLTLTNTLGYHRDYGVKGDSTGIGTPSLDKFALTYVWTHNVLAGESGWGKPYPAVTWHPGLAEHEANFHSDYSLVSNSVYRNAGTDGLDLGAVAGTGSVPTSPPPPPEEQCDDGLDNDGDGDVDEGCAPPPQEVCGDGVDNDGDGQTDEGCAPPPEPETCGDGIDNDQDGEIDEGCSPPPAEICGDGIDNDSDGHVDEGCVVMPADTAGPVVTLWSWSETKNHIKFRVEASDPSGIAGVRVEFNGTVVTESTSSTVNVTIPLARVGAGTGEVRVYATDRVGNVTMISRAVQVTASRGSGK